jgi:hypothetical protein
MKPIILLITTLACVGFTSCSSPPNVTGCWRDQHSQLVSLKEDGSLSLDGVNGKFRGSWQLVGNDRLHFELAGLSSDTHTIVQVTPQLMIIKYNGVLEYTWKRDVCPAAAGK